MANSIYEEYAKAQQPLQLQKAKTLEDMISLIVELKKHRSSEYIETLEEYVSDLYNIGFESIKRLVEGDEYWLV